jgi:hypothetical protein
MTIARARRPVLRSVLLLAAATFAAGAASAAVNVPFTASFGNNRGPLIDFPAIGEGPCPSVQVGINFAPPGATSPATLPTMDPFGGTNPQVANPQGCILGSGSASVTGAGSFVVQPGGISKPLPPSGVTNRVMALVPNVLSVQTRNAFSGPPAAPIYAIKAGTPVTTVGTPAAWRNFRASAWMTQTGRVGPSFTWCWGAGGCGTPGSPATIGAGTRPAVVKYRGGPNRFGGTMGLILKQAFGQLALISGLGVPPGGVILLPLQTGTNSLPEGRGYGAYQTNPIPSGAIYLHYTVTPTSGFIGGVTSPVFVVPAATNFARGFPWTTGTVLVRKTGTVGGSPDYQTITAMGSDGRNAAGTMGNITLVAGSMTETLLAGTISDTPNMSVLRLNFLPEPGAALQLLSGALGLFGLQLWRRRRS